MPRLLLFLLLATTLLHAQNPPPQLLIPNTAQGKAESQKLGGKPRPAFFSKLGPLAERVVAYFAMDDLQTGGLTWSRSALSIRPNAGVAAKTAAGRSYLDFSASHSKVTIAPALKFGPQCTLAAWVELPGPTKDAAIWQSSNADLLNVKERKLTYWTKGNEHGLWAENAEAFQGWHHVALVGNGRKTQVYFDAKPLALVDDLPVDDLGTIGNHRTKNDQRMMAAGIDEQYLFDRALTGDEITKLMDLTASAGAK